MKNTLATNTRKVIVLTLKVLITLLILLSTLTTSNEINYVHNPNNPFLRDHHDSIPCKICLSGAKKVQELARKRVGLGELKKVATEICVLAVKLEKEVCEGAVNLYAESLIDGLITRYVSPAYICTELKICQPHYRLANHTEFAENLLKEERIYHKDSEIESSLKRISHVSDIHLDLNYTEGVNGDCNEPLCCRNNKMNENLNEYSVKNEIMGKFLGLFSEKTDQDISKNNLSGKYGYLGKCDLPLTTLDSLFEDLFSKDPEIVFLTGDNVAHDTWKTTLTDALAATKAIVNTVLKHKTSNALVYPTLGNHESGVVDNIDFRNATFLHDFTEKYAAIYSPLLEHDSAALKSFSTNGYYSSKYKDSDIRIISLNSYNCDALNFYLLKNSTDPGNQFVWLENELRNAEKSNEVVYIIGHIPPGNDAYLSECSLVYKALIDRFSHIIKAQMFGHSHDDELRLISTFFNETETSSIAFIAPSATTYTDHHPSYRTYYYNTTSLEYVDYDQMRLNITKANSNTEKVPEWELAYKFSNLYKTIASDKTGIYNKVMTLGEDTEFTKEVLFQHDAWKETKKSKINEDVVKKGNELKCHFTKDVYDNDVLCTKDNSMRVRVNQAIEKLQGKWYEVIDD